MENPPCLSSTFNLPEDSHNGQESQKNIFTFIDKYQISKENMEVNPKIMATLLFKRNEDVSDNVMSERNKTTSIML